MADNADNQAQVNKDGNQARERLLDALRKIDKKMKTLEARPTREEIEVLKCEREKDLQAIQELRAQIEAIKSQQE